MADMPRQAQLFKVVDKHTAILSWLAGVNSMRTPLNGVRHFGQNRGMADLYRHFRLDLKR